MTPGEIKLLNWLLLALGATLIFSGWRTIRKRRTRTQYGEHLGKSAACLGWFWLILGFLLLLAAVLHVPFLKTLGRIFLESDS